MAMQAPVIRDSTCLKYEKRFRIDSGNSILKLCIAYWPSQWRAATAEETVIDLIFGVFSSRKEAIKVVKENTSPKEWKEYGGEFVYEDLDVDKYHPIPHI
jgi:hypothetical protein